jgi:hypothetical protein
MAAIVALALGAAFLGRTSSTPDDGNTRVRAALKAQEVPVLVVTAGRGGAAAEFVKNARAAVAGQQRARLIHVNAHNPVEREVAAGFPKGQLPLVVVFGLDGVPGYTKSSQVEPDAIQQAIAKGLTKPPVKIEEHVHSHSCGHSH